MKTQEGCAHISRVIPTLFDQEKPVHHKTDPPTSKIAEDKITRSGKRQSRCKRIYNCLKRHGAMTSGEIAYILDLDYHQVQKRIYDLQNTWPPKVKSCGERFCAKRKTKCTVWIVK